ncbi:MAG: glycosyltransferase family 2 protein, partial [Gaiellaceae bacterium]
QQAMDSVLGQAGVDLELLVVDDGCSDDTPAIIASCTDPRVRVLRTPKAMGSGYVYNLVLRESRSPFIAHVDADAVLMPGALRAMLAAFESCPAVGAAHCYYIEIDEHGQAHREAVRQRFRERQPPSFDYRAAVINDPDVINHLRTYRREVLEELGGFDESLPVGAEYDLALRLLSRHTITLVPEFLYAQRVHGCGAPSSPAVLQAYRIQRRLIRQGTVSFRTRPHLVLSRLIRPRVDTLAIRFKRGQEVLQRARSRLRWRTTIPLRAGLYRAVQHLTWWPPPSWPGSPRQRRPAERRTEPRIAYYVRGFPKLSETFIQREVSALARAGIAVHVIAHLSGDQRHLNASARALIPQTYYLDPIDPQRLAN